MNNMLAVLYAVNSKQPLSQRDIAKKTDLSLGKVNALLRHLAERGLLATNAAKKKGNYQLTDAGYQLLAQWLREEQQRKVELFSPESQVQQAVILAAGQARGIEEPVCLLANEKGQRLLERTIGLLINQGITKIVLVAGFQAAQLTPFAERFPQVVLVENTDFAKTGTMASLALAAEEISGDFLLVEGDLVFEERGLQRLLQHEHDSSMLVTSVRQHADEAMVELKDGFVYKMSKDIHQFNRIDGEMIGLSKVSLPFFKKMLAIYAHNDNPYVNYEYIMIDVAQAYRLGCARVDDFLWGEIDEDSQSHYVLRTVWPRIRQKEKRMALEAVRNIACKALDIKEQDIDLLESAGGMTNKNYKLVVHGQAYIVRVAGNGTERFINRHSENTNSRIANVLDLDVDTQYFDETTGTKVSLFIPEAETLSQETAKYRQNMKMTTSLLRRLHHSDVDFENRFDVFKEIVKYEQLTDEVGGAYFDGYAALRKQVMTIEQRLQTLGLQLRPCHIDTVPENFVRSGDMRSYLIDWEYSGTNDPIWDLAAHSLECGFNEEEEARFLAYYYGADQVDDVIREKMLLFQICQDFLWSVWTLFKESRGDEFGTYGLDRYQRAARNMARWQAMKTEGLYA